MSLLWESNRGYKKPDKKGRVDYRDRRMSPTGVFNKIKKSPPWKGAKFTREDGFLVLRKGNAILRIKP